MASWGDVEVYNQMIDDLAVFCKQVEDACGVMTTAAATCADTMESDAASLKASKKVLLAVKTYGEAREMAQNLAAALTEERDDLIEYLKALETMGEDD